jgi:hypothetical protein
VPTPPEPHCGVVVGHTSNHVLRRIDAIDEGPQSEKSPRDQELSPTFSQFYANRKERLYSRTFNQTTMRFQKPIMLISKGVAPCQAASPTSLIATTYIWCSSHSIVKKQKRKRNAYETMTVREMERGFLSCRHTVTSKKIRHASIQDD